VLAEPGPDPSVDEGPERGVWTGGMVMRRGEMRDDGGTTSVPASDSVSGDLRNRWSSEEGTVKCTSALRVGFSSWAVAVDCELDLFRVVRLGECGADGRESVSEDIGEDMLEMTCVGVRGV